MTSPRDPDETVLSQFRKALEDPDVLGRLQEALKDPSLSLDGALEHPVARMLMETLKRTFSSPAPPEGKAAARTLGLARYCDSPAIIRAAILDTFALNQEQIHRLWR
jgi:hypothetical protein